MGGRRPPEEGGNGGTHVVLQLPELSSDDAGRPPAIAVPAVVLPGQVRGGHEHEALVGAAVL